MRFEYKKVFPIIFGDLLLSGSPTTEGLRLPTTGKVIELTPNRCEPSPVGLRQKVSLISENLVMGWSGNYLTAKDILHDLYWESQIEPFTRESLGQYLQARRIILREQGVSLLGYIEDEEGIARIGYGHYPTMTKEHGEIGYIGLGSRSLDQLLYRVPEGPSVINGDLDIADQAIHYALSLTGLMIVDEFSTDVPMRQLFGGGYEIAYSSDGRFHKLDNVSYLFWPVKCSSSEINISNPVLLINLSYENDILVFRRIEFDNSSCNTSINQSWFAILPIHRNVNKSELHGLVLPRLNMNIMCNCFVVTHESKDPEILVRTDYRRDLERHMRFIEDDDNVTFKIEENYLEDVAKAIHDRYQ